MAAWIHWGLLHAWYGRFVLPHESTYTLKTTIVNNLSLLKADNRIAFIGHHLFSLFGVALGLRNEYGMWFIAFRLLTEISNPFMNMRGLIEMMGIKKSASISRFNGKLCVASFMLAFIMMNLKYDNTC